MDAPEKPVKSKLSQFISYKKNKESDLRVSDRGQQRPSITDEGVCSAGANLYLDELGKGLIDEDEGDEESKDLLCEW